MPRVLKTILGLVIIAAIAMAFGWILTWKLGLAPEAAREVLLLYGAAAGVLSILLVAGTVMRLRGHGYYIIVGGVVFLAVDAFVWWGGASASCRGRNSICMVSCRRVPWGCSSVPSIESLGLDLGPRCGSSTGP